MTSIDLIKTIQKKNCGPLNVPLLTEFKSKNNKISLEKLLQFIEINKDKLHTFINKTSSYEEIKILHNNETKFLDILPPNLDKIFNIYKSTMMRSAVISYYSGNINCSMISSILNCLLTSYLINIENHINYIKNIIDKIRFFINNDYLEISKKKKKNYDVIELERDLLNFKYTEILNNVICDFFTINIVILDTQKDKIIFNGENFISYRKTVFLFLINENNYEPIFIKNKSYLQGSDNMINYLIFNNFIENNYQKQFKSEKENLLVYITQKKELKLKTKLIKKEIVTLDRNIYIETELSENSIPDIEQLSEKYTKNELKNKMTAELKILANKYNIPLYTSEITEIKGKAKSKTKAELINDILNKTKEN
jgi:hypothetical protein